MKKNLPSFRFFSPLLFMAALLLNQGNAQTVFMTEDRETAATGQTLQWPTNGTAFGNDSVFTTISIAPPTVITNGAYFVVATNAGLSANVNPNGSATTVSFQYGLTPAYGSVVPYGTINGNTMTTIYDQAFNLTPSTLYHYRAVGTSAGGTVYGNDTTFTTTDSISCQAQYTYGADTSAPHTTVHFLDESTTSTGYITSWQWQFGDGTSQTVVFPVNPNVTHTYLQSGIYTVCLTIHGTDSTCNDMTCQVITVDTIYGCHAEYTHVADTANPNMVHFFDQSTWNIVSWEWNFGDGSPGSTVQNPTHIFIGAALAHTVCLTIHGADSNCYDVICHTVNIDPGPGCQAYFTYTSSPVPGYSILSFIDLSTGNPAYWYWNFGDPASGANNVSTLQNPTHAYTPGTYNVCLSISGNNCSSTYCKIIVVTDSINSHHVYGKVFADGIPIRAGIVSLFSVDTIPPYQPYLDATNIDSSGTYHFTMVPDGDYYVNAIPIGVSGYLPTFYGDVLFWEDAAIVHLGTPNNPYNINLVAAAPMYSGNGSITGQIYTSGLKSNYLDKITMLLMNENGQAIYYNCVQSSGSFSFASLAFGTYYLKAEMAGIASEPVKVIISQENPNPNVVMTLTGNTITGINDPAMGINSWTVYPNPVLETAHIIIVTDQSLDITIEIYAMTGALFIKEEKALSTGVNKVTIPTISLNSGIYTLRIRSAEGVYLTRKLVKIE